MDNATTTETPALRFRFLGNTDEVSVCDCCGKKDLKSTVALENEDGTVLYYGVVCAARAMKIEAVEVRRGARKADDDRHAREMAAKRAAWDAEDARFQEFLDRAVGPMRDWGGRPDRAAQLAAGGGMAKLRAAYSAEVL